MAFKQDVSLNLRNMSRDPHQMLIQEMHREDREDATKIDRIGGRPIDQRVGASDQYLILDSAEANTSESYPEKGIFAFSIQAGTGTGTEIIGVHDELHTISEIEFQSFPLPNIKVCYTKNEERLDFPTMPTAPVNSACNEYTTYKTKYNSQFRNFPNLPPLYCVDICNPDYPASSTEQSLFKEPLPTNIFETSANRFEIQISQTSLQSFADRCGFRHNFAFDVVPFGTGQVYASPVSPVYVFTDPINRIDNITLTFFDAYRCKPLSFGPSLVCDVRVGITTQCINRLDNSGINSVTQNIDSLTFWIKSNKPILKPGDKFYVRRNAENGKPFDSSCMQPYLYNYIVGCGQDSPSENAMVVSRVIDYNDNIDDVWGYEVNPFVDMYIFDNYPGFLANTPPILSNPIDILTTKQQALTVGFTTFNPENNIIALIPLNADLDPYNIITCVKNKVSFLFRYGDSSDEKLLVNECKIILRINEIFREYGSITPPSSDYNGIYYVACPQTDIKTNVSYSGIQYDAIKFTFSNRPFRLGAEDGRAPEKVSEFRRTRLVPNIPPLCICIPGNQLRIPVRIRRILRRITQLSGL